MCKWIGFHLRGSVLAGERLGRRVAPWALRRYFGPAGDSDDWRIRKGRFMHLKDSGTGSGSTRVPRRRGSRG
jgi:hypothetical protein